MMMKQATRMMFVPALLGLTLLFTFQNTHAADAADNEFVIRSGWSGVDVYNHLYKHALYCESKEEAMSYWPITDNIKKLVKDLSALYKERKEPAFVVFPVYKGTKVKGTPFILKWNKNKKSITKQKACPWKPIL